MKYLIRVLAFVFTFVVINAYGQTRIKTNVIELQNRIEAQINHNVETLVSTKLDPGTYKLASRVKVVEIPPQKPQKKEEENKDEEKDPNALENQEDDWPAGMGIGAIDVRALIESYKKEIEELKLYRKIELAKQQQPQIVKEAESLPSYVVTRIEVVVGLSELYDDEFVAEFQQWMTRRVQFDYGNRAVATINKFTPVPKKVEEPLPEPVPEPFTWQDLLPFVPYALLAFGLVLAALLMGRGLRKLGEGAKRLVVEHDSPFKMERTNKYEGEPGPLPSNSMKEEDDDEQKAPELVEMFSGAKPVPEDLVGKVIYLCQELESKVNDLVRVWLDNGDEGFLKTAVLIDTIISNRDLVKSGKEIETPLDIDLAVTYEVNISEAYREASALESEKKLELLTKVYWDLLGTKTLGLKALRKPFDFMQSMNDVNYAEALRLQEDEGSKALTVLFSGAQKAKYALETSEDSEKESLVENMIKMSRVKKKQIWDMDSKAQSKVLNTGGTEDDNVVNLFPRVKQILSSLSPIDELVILRKIAGRLDDQGASLKQQYSTLAFVDEWHQEYVAKLVSTAVTSELVDLIQVLPEVKDAILSSCTERVRMVVSDDLKVHKLDESGVAKSIRQLRTKWRNLCVTENIQMSQVISFRKKGDLKSVA